MSIRHFGFSTALAALLLFIPSRSWTAELVVSQYGRVTATLPWAVASEKGFFADEGIKIDKIISGGGGGTTLRNMLASDLPYGEVATSAALAAIRSGLDIVIVNTASDHIGEIALVMYGLLLLLLVTVMLVNGALSAWERRLHRRFGQR
jgi:NitT/TauT family transport system substrate-binding protein